MYRICSTLGCLFLGSSLLPCRFAIPSVFPRIIVGRWVFVLFTIIIRSSLLPRRGPRAASHKINPKCVCVFRKLNLTFRALRDDSSSATSFLSTR